MSGHEIEEVADRYAGQGLMGKATKFLLDFMHTINANSDGWAYWHHGTKCADKLVALIKAADAPRVIFPAKPVPITEAALRKAVVPIKTFITKHNAQNKERGRSTGLICPTLDAPPPVKKTRGEVEQAVFDRIHALDDEALASVHNYLFPGKMKAIGDGLLYEK